MKFECWLHEAIHLIQLNDPVYFYNFRDLSSEVFGVFLAIHHCGSARHTDRRSLSRDSPRPPDKFVRVG